MMLPHCHSRQLEDTLSGYSQCVHASSIPHPHHSTSSTQWVDPPPPPTTTHIVNGGGAYPERPVSVILTAAVFAGDERLLSMTA